MIDKHRKPTKLLWVDMEMTGLDPTHDLILEVAAEVTDFDFKTIASYEAVVQQPAERVIERMQLNSWWQEYPENRDEFLRKMVTGKPPKDIEHELIALVEKEFGTEPAVLAGNSIHNDRGFIRSHWPSLDLKLHYRMLDVSSLKVYMQGKFGIEFEKKEIHRAFDDIQASIAEWQYYMELLAESAVTRPHNR